MTSTLSTLRLSTADGDIAVKPDRLVVAGYTGRDEAAVRRHIDELAAIGVPAPATVPAFYDLDPAELSLSGVIEVPGAATSGEVEPVLIRVRGRHYLTVGSDHTDRDIERSDILRSKAACPKPLAGTAVDLGDDPTAIDWDGIVVNSWVDDKPYQQGSLAQLLPIGEVLGRWDRLGSAGEGDTLVLFGGTVPLLTGAFSYGRCWRMRLDLPDQQALDLTYHVTVRSN